MRKLPLLLSIASIAAIFLASDIDHAQVENFPVITLNAGINLIKAEVASTPTQREQGLMYRTKLGPNEGMAFTFDTPTNVCMWMKNTLIPLSVAFIDDNGKIVNIEEMKAQTLDAHCATRAVSYALEMNADWFRQKSIKPGMSIDGLPDVK